MQEIKEFFSSIQMKHIKCTQQLTYRHGLTDGVLGIIPRGLALLCVNVSLQEALKGSPGRNLRAFFCFQNLESNWLDEGLVLKTSITLKGVMRVRVPHSPLNVQFFDVLKIILEHFAPKWKTPCKWCETGLETLGVVFRQRFEPSVFRLCLIWRCGRMVLQHPAKVWSGNWPAGSNPVISAIIVGYSNGLRRRFAKAFRIPLLLHRQDWSVTCNIAPQV